MVKYLPINVVLNIYGMVGCNIFYLDRDYFIEIEKLRKKFEENPIKLNYRRVKYKTQCKFNGFGGRPSMLVDNKTTVLYISKGPIGIIFQDGCVMMCKHLLNKILPDNYIINSTYPNINYTKYTWDIYLSFVNFEDAEKHNKYVKYWFYDYK